MQARQRQSEGAVVAIVDDDESVREAIGALLRSVGYVVQVYPSPQEFLLGDDARLVNCLVLDVRMPAISGLDLQAE